MPKKRLPHFQIAMADWCFRLFGSHMDTGELIRTAKELGVKLDLVSHEHWAQIQAAGVGLSCVIPDMGVDPNANNTPMPPFVPGFNNPVHEGRVYNAINAALDRASAAGIKFVLVFTGMATEEIRFQQFGRIVDGFTKVRESATESLIEKAVRLGIKFTIEMLNTKGEEATWKGHPGYLGCSMRELVNEVVQKVNSPNFGLLFDAYHVAMMDQDVLEMVSSVGRWVNYVHVAGVMRQEEGHHPQNRGEITLPGQQVNYPVVLQALVPYTKPGTPLLLEYIPTTDRPEAVIANLRKAIDLCSVRKQ